MKFSGVLIGSERPQALKEYYSKLFGKPGWEQSGYFGWKFGDAYLMFGPHDQVKGQNREPGRVIWNLDAEDVPTDFARLKAAGAKVVREPYHPGESTNEWIATFADPDGNYFQIGSGMSM